ncbi:MAG: DUF2156 domain-containing protein [Clostridia bacterium]|nr:DUF2156 domain-containing protein [Clostridia bacterium]
MNFKKIELCDKDVLTPFLQGADELTCELSFTNLLIWQPLYNNCYCIADGVLYLKSYDDSIETFSLPIGDIDIADGVKKIIDHLGYMPSVWAQAGKRFDEFKKHYGEHYDIFESRNEFDYIYNSTDLINLSGKKYHSKRNHISTFSKQFDWHYEEITADNLEKVKLCAKKWYAQYSDKDEELKTEMHGVELMLDNLEFLNLDGGAIIIADEVVAFSLGSKINDQIYNIHTEKALSGFDTAYAVINREFAARNAQNYQYINREDDLGIEGLRRSKLSYKPQIILPKYICTIKENI